MNHNNKILIDEFRHSMNKSRYTTIEQYVEIIEKFAQLEHIDDLKYTTRANIISYFDAKKHCKASTKNKHLTALKRFFDYLNRVGEITINPVSISYFKDDEDNNYSALNLGDKKIEMGSLIDTASYLTSDESQRLIKILTNNINNSSSNIKRTLAIRDKLLYTLMLNRGFRVEELLGMELNQIIEDGNYLYIPATKSKSRKARLVGLSNELNALLQQYLSVRHFLVKQDTDYLFLSMNGKKMHRNNSNENLKAYAKLAKIQEDKVHNHLLRHTFGSHHITNHTIRETASIMGHTDIKTTMIYSHDTEELSKQASSNFIFDSFI